MMGKKMAVVADDLTGANDTGVQFSKHGFKTVVMLDTISLPDSDDDEVVVFNTDSRAMVPVEAYRRVAKVAVLIKSSQIRYVYKKVDSTLRGNLGAEIDAILNTCGQRVAIVAPAFPANNRVTIGGYHILQSLPLEETEVARDPVCPVKETHLPTLLAGQTKGAVGHIGVKSILQGADGIFAELRRLISIGKTVIACDVWRTEHLEAIAAAGQRLRLPVLWVGSAGLAECLPPMLGMAAAKKDKMPIVVVAGSVSQVTRNQVARLHQLSGVSRIEVNTSALLLAEAAQKEFARSLSLAMTAAAESRDIVIALDRSDDIVAQAKVIRSSLGLSDQDTSCVIAKALGELCRQLVKNQPVGGLVLTGGDIALSCCRALGATGLTVLKEVAPGIPLGSLRGGAYDGLRVVTKAGAFGREEALEEALKSLRQ